MTDKPHNIVRTRHDQRNPFAQISRKVLQNATISWEARGVLAYLLSKPGDWDTQFNDLVRQGPGQADRMRRILKELETSGHVVRRRSHGPDGRWQWETLVFENPADAAPDGGPDNEPCAGLPYMADPHTGKPDVENRHIYKDQNLTNKESTNIESESAPAQRSTPQDDALFNAPKITLVNHNPVTSPVTSGQKLTPGVNAPRRAKQIPLPANYPLTEEMRAWAAMEYPALGERIDTEHKKFCNHARSTGKLLAEWRPAWETWMINAVGDFAPKAQGGTTRGHYESKGERAARNLRLLAEECATAAEDDQGANHQESSRLLA